MRDLSLFRQFLKSILKEILQELLPELLQELHYNQSTSSEEFLDAQKSAAFIGESLSSFYRRTSDRDIPFYKRGKKIFCKKSELIAWLESGKKKSTKEIEDEEK